MFSNIPLLLSGIISGMILFQSAIVAPSVFKILSEKNAGPFLRVIFPKLFLATTLLGCIQLLFSYFLISLNVFIIGLITSILMATCYLIIPSTNKARDEGDNKNSVGFTNKCIFYTYSINLKFVIILFINLGYSVEQKELDQLAKHFLKSVPQRHGIFSIKY